tara:strand:+ start:55 stop:645 length:591 start_codon:yes stop_codon:yes gene_type:complete
MTTRLKILSVGLCLSIIYSVYDWYDRNRTEKSNQVVVKKKNTRKRTAKAGRNRAKNRAIQESKKVEQAKMSQKFAQAPLTNLSDEISQLSGWSRNPFISMAEPIRIKSKSIAQKTVTDSFPKMITPEITFQEEELMGVESLNIETVASVGEKVFVIINGQRLREGDLINNLLIESIDNQKITFKMGNTTIIKDVGS